MPNNWKTYKLTDLGTIARGKSKHRPRDASHLYGGEYPFIQTGDVKASNHRLNYHTQTYSEAGLQQSKLWPKDTMCITIAANIAETAILNYPACFPDSIIGFIANDKVCDIDFVEYLMQYFKKQIQSHSIGSVQDNINLATFERVEFLVPPLPEQRAIASILSSLDDKIELNLQMNKTLEEMAMTLYQHWFVDFGPFKDGNFIDSELGLIPEGWEVKRLGDITLELRRGISPKYTEDEGIKVVNQRCIRNHLIDFSLARKNDVSKKKVDGRQIQKGDVLVNSTGVGTLGRMAPVIDLKEDVVVDSHVTVIRPNPVIFRLNTFARSMLSIESIIEHMGEGSTGQTELSRVQLSELRILVPPIEIQSDLENQLISIAQKTVSNIYEIQTLTNLRDTLLPKLISGEVRVKEAEQTLAEVL